jgi:hypothetical protein
LPPQVSRATHVTGVPAAETGNMLPDGGVQTIETFGQQGLVALTE